MSEIVPVILCGGVGSRLWPLSRKSLPKQFAPLIGTQSLFEAAVSSVDRDEFADPIVVGCFSSNKIGEALSRESIVHAGIKRGKLAKTLTIEVKRLSGFIDLVPMDWPDREHEIKIK